MHVQRNGRTGYEIRNGQKFHSPLLEFGQPVMVKAPGADDHTLGKLEPRFIEGLWFGRCHTSNEHLVSTVDGMVRSRTVKPLKDMDGTDLWKQHEWTPWRPNRSVAEDPQPTEADDKTPEGGTGGSPTVKFL